MPDPRSLNIVDRIRILRVPENDLRQRERELAEKTEMAGWTADSIERIIEQPPIVTIARIDEYGCVWYDASMIGPEGNSHVEPQCLILRAEKVASSKGID